MAKTIDDLRAIRAELLERRRSEAYHISGPHQEERIEKVARLHIAIDAIDAVIKEGLDQPEADATGFILL
jgi:hypothetical protein